MAAATQYPSGLRYFQWATPTAANPRLSAPISSTGTTLTFTSAPLDSTGTVITGDFLMGIRKSDDYVETIYVPAAGMSADGLTATAVIRGIDLEGLDYTIGDTSNAVAFDADAAVFCNVSAVIGEMLVNAIQGGIATGANLQQVGDATAADMRWVAFNDQATKPEVFFDESGERWRVNAGDDLLGAANWEMVCPIGTTAQLAAIPGLPATGMIGGDTTLGEVVFREGSAWVQKSGGGSVPNMSDIVAGKGQQGTQAHVNAGTDTGVSGAPNVLIPSRTAIAIQNSVWNFGVSSAGSDTYAITLTPAVASYSDGQVFYVKADVANTGAATLNINAVGAKSIVKNNDQALATGDIEANQIFSVAYNSDDDVFKMLSHTAIPAGSDLQEFTVNGTWTKPPGAKFVKVISYGGGGGGAGGEGGAGNVAGGTAGGGGARVEKVFDAGDLGATETVTIGAAGSAGTGGSSAIGTDGTAGGNTTFGSIMTAFGGGFGFAVAHGSNGYGGGGGGEVAKGGDGSVGAGSGGAPGGATTTAGISGQGAASIPTTAAGHAMYGGGAGGGHEVTNGSYNGGDSFWGNAGGGAGGMVGQPGKAGGGVKSYSSGNGGAGGATGGANGTAGTAGDSTKGGTGGGGGGSQASGTGGIGGAGAVPGSGGGGGGAGNTVGGAAGVGGAGQMWVYSF